MKIKKILFLLTLLLVLPFTHAQAEEANVTLFYGDGCPHCAKEEEYLEVLQKQLGENLNVQ